MWDASNSVSFVTCFDKVQSQMLRKTLNNYKHYNYHTALSIDVYQFQVLLHYTWHCPFPYTFLLMFQFPGLILLELMYQKKQSLNCTLYPQLLFSKELCLSLYKKILEAFAQSIFRSCSLYNISLIIDYLHSTLLKQEWIYSMSFSQSCLVKENKKRR